MTKSRGFGLLIRSVTQTGHVDDTSRSLHHAKTKLSLVRTTLSLTPSPSAGSLVSLPLRIAPRYIMATDPCSLCRHAAGPRSITQPWAAGICHRHHHPQLNWETLCPFAGLSSLCVWQRRLWQPSLRSVYTAAWYHFIIATLEQPLPNSARPIHCSVSLLIAASLIFFFLPKISCLLVVGPPSPFGIAFNSVVFHRSKRPSLPSWPRSPYSPFEPTL